MIFAAIVMIAGFTNTITAQTAASVTTNAGVRLVVPMTLTETAPLHFGTITLLDGTAGTVVLSTVNTRSFTGGVTTTAVSTTSTNATYNVTGTKNSTYALTLPLTITVTETIGNTVIMTISDLTVLFNGGTEKSGISATSLLSASGTDNFKLGGTLTVVQEQIGGIYSGTLPVSVDYN